MVDYANAVEIDNRIVLGSNTTKFSAGNGVIATQAGVISQTGGSRPLEKIGEGTLILTGNNTYTGGTTVHGGTLQLGDATRRATIRGTVTNDATLEIVNANTSPMTSIANRGAVHFRNANTAGGMIIANNVGGLTAFRESSSAGTARITAVEGFVSFSNNSSAANARITADFQSQVGFNDSGTAGNATIVSDGFASFRHNSTAGAARITNTNGLVFRDSAKAGTATIANNAGFARFEGTSSADRVVITNAALAGLFFDDRSTAGASTINNAGQVSFADRASGGSAAFTNTSADAVLFIDNLSSSGIAIGSMAGAGQFVLVAKDLTFGSLNTNTEVSGRIFGDGGSLTKVGTGTTILSGQNSYTGATTINAGALIVNGSIELSSLTTVNAGAMLGGNGTVGALNVNGGTLSPGNSIGTITVKGSLVLSTAAAYLVEVSPTAADRTNVTGAARLAGTMTLQVASGTYQVGKQYVLLHADGGRTGTFTTDPPRFCQRHGGGAACARGLGARLRRRPPLQRSVPDTTGRKLHHRRGFGAARVRSRLCGGRDQAHERRNADRQIRRRGRFRRLDLCRHRDHQIRLVIASRLTESSSGRRH